MKVVTFAKLKGGVGATTIAVNFACHLGKNGHKVLFLDFDSQLNATGFFDTSDAQENVKKIFQKQPLEHVANVYENVWFISGSMTLDEMEVLLSADDNKNMILYRWFHENQEVLSGFDYVIIDNHPGFTTVVKNAICVSDVVVCPLIPSEFSEMSKDNIEIRFGKFKEDFWDYRKKQSHINADLVYVGNMIGQDKESKRFLENGQEFVATFPKRIIFNRSLTEYRPICEMAEDKRLQKEYGDLFGQIEAEFEKLKKVIDEKE